MVRASGVAAMLLAGTAPAAWANPQEIAPPASETPAPAEDPALAEDEADIVVTGQQRGAVPGDIPPEIQLSPADIRSYGVSNVAELLAELAPQTRSGRGRDGGAPVVLINGRRVSGFNEIRDLPTEAIERVDILPEEVALKFGYRADQRVVNFVLRRRFRAITAEAGARAATQGGTATTRSELGVLRIGGNNRINLAVRYSGTSALLESERDIVPTTSSLFDPRGNITGFGGAEIDPALSALAGRPVTSVGVPASALTAPPALSSFASGTVNSPDLSNYRTLIGASENLEINANYARPIGTVNASVNARLELSSNESLIGPTTATLRLPASSGYSPFAGDTQLLRAIDSVDPLGRSRNAQEAHLGFGLNGDMGRWRWSVTGNYDRNTSRTFTETGIDIAPIQAAIDADPNFNPFGPIPRSLIAVRPDDVARSTSSVGAIEAQASGPIAQLPGGDLSTSIRFTGRTSDLQTSSVRGAVTRSSDIGRDLGSAQINVDLPLTSRRRAFLDAIGDLSLNANAEVEHYSDFGTLTTYGYGLNWSPIGKLRFLVSVTEEEGAPSAQQLGDAILTTPNVRVFDYVRGESVEVTSIAGGNPNLTADSRSVLKLGMNLRPFDQKDLSFSANYVRSTTRNAISGFPALTAEVEAAFPQRFVRDAGGRLIQVDSRAVNFARNHREELRWGFNFSAPIKSTLQKQIEAWRAGGPPPPGFPARPGGPQGAPGQQPAVAEGGPPPAEGQPRARRFGEGGARGGGQQGGFFGRQGGGPGGPTGGGRGRGFGGGPGGGAGAGRLQFALYHTWRLADEIRIRDGLPAIDLLNGGASGNNGGTSRHEIELQSGLAKDGFGLRLTGEWKSGTEVRGGTLANAETLAFSDLTTVNLRLFADLGQQRQLVRKTPWLRGTRISLAVENVFDARQRVTNQAGVVPVSYQPDLIDPRGRTIFLNFRKLFF